MIEQIFDLIAPHLCINCRKTGSLLCTACLESLPAPPERCYRCARLLKRKGLKYACTACRRQIPIDAIIGVTGYEAAAKELISRLKFERASAAAEIIAMSIAKQCTGTPSDTIVTYAPTATKRVRVRGYDQSQLIAKHLAKQLGLPCSRLLYRIGQTRQVGASRQLRKEQAGYVFRPRVRNLEQRNIILIDDVITTGATLEAAATVLKQAGAGRIVAAVFAIA